MSLLRPAAMAAAIIISSGASAADLITDASFACSLGKTIDAAFYPDRVSVVLSDGRDFTLPQTMSGSGARYANANETIVFWNKGNTAFLTEGTDATPTYNGCIRVSDEVPDSGWLVFASSEFGFSLRYPPGYTVDGGYVYQGLGPNNDITGVAFTIPAAMTDGTNLASDTKLSVETLPDLSDCAAPAFLPSGATPAETITENGTEYSVASLSDAGAGNLYDQRVYALVGTSPCLAVRTFIHSTNLANYDPGTVVAFDEQALVDQFDAMRRTLVIGQ
ncbi:MliC family protein [Bauldia sp.]|uniref:MliC family protein n=1 Tax=Bauldia sp. TaxID=2575872 RepID=UPI003BA9C972